MNFSALFTTALALFLFIVLGFILRKIGLTDDSFLKKLSTLVAKVGQPFLIVYSIVKLEYAADTLRSGLAVVGWSLAAHTFLALGGLLFFFRLHDADERKIHEYACTFSNAAFFGFPILSALFGEIGLFYGAFYVIIHNVGIWSYGVFLMASGKGDRFSLRRLLLNLGTISCAIGLGIYIARIPMPGFLLTLFSGVAGLCTPLSLIITGALIAAVPLRALFLNPKIYYFCAVKLVLMPLLAAGILHFFDISGLIPGINLSVFLVTMLSLPPASFTVLFADMYEVKPAYAGQLIGVGTALSPFTILLVMKLTEYIL